MFMEMPMLPWILLFSALGSVVSVAVAALFLLFPQPVRLRLLPCLLSYATGTLLGAAFLGMIPKGVEQAAVLPISATVLGGIVLFFILEKLVLWRHCHEPECEQHGRAGPLILVGDAFHNFVDGVVIAAAFLVSFPLGVATALAVIAHEVPQEVGDFAILLHSGYQRGRALLLNLLSSAATLPGALLGYLFLAEVKGAVPYILALSAASFIYIAVADLVPSLHKHVGLKSSLRQVVLLLAGIATIALFRFGH
jgi:zinc and cadmium transporter